MKILKSKTYRKLMDQNELLSLNVSQAATNLTSSIRLIEVQKVKIDQLEKDRLYVNFTRDKLGRLHPIKTKK